jgi:hypothetical protein
MIVNDVGPFSKAGKFAENFTNMLIFNAAVFDLIDWMQDVEAGLKDPSLPEDVKAQVFVDYAEIKKRFNEISGSIANV